MPYDSLQYMLVPLFYMQYAGSIFCIKNGFQLLFVLFSFLCKMCPLVVGNYSQSSGCQECQSIDINLSFSSSQQFQESSLLFPFPKSQQCTCPQETATKGNCRWGREQPPCQIVDLQRAPSHQSGRSERMRMKEGQAGDNFLSQFLSLKWQHTKINKV